MPETFHLNETQTLAIKDDTISFFDREKVSGTSRSGREWSRWRNRKQITFSWKSGYLNRFERSLVRGNVLFINTTPRPFLSPHEGMTVALRSRMNVPDSAVEPTSFWSVGPVTRAAWRESYPLITIHEAWKPVTGVSQLLRASTLDEGVRKFFGATRYSSDLQLAVLQTSELGAVAFAREFRGLVKDFEIVDMLKSFEQGNGVFFDGNNFAAGDMRALRKTLTLIDEQYRVYLLKDETGIDTIMSIAARLMAVLAKDPDWYPRSRPKTWRELRAEVKEKLEGRPATGRRGVRERTPRGYAATSGGGYSSGGYSSGGVVLNSASINRSNLGYNSPAVVNYVNGGALTPDLTTFTIVDEAVPPVPFNVNDF